MSWPFGSSSFRSSESYYESFHRDDPRSSFSHKPAKPKTKPVKTEKKPANNRDAHLEKIELFACKVCKKRYTTKAGYSRHFTSAHESGKVVKEIKKKPANISSRALSAWSPSPTAAFICNHCGKELSSKASLDRHKATHDRSPRSLKLKARPTQKVTSTTTKTTNINVNNTVYYNGYTSPGNFFTVSNRFWD